MILDLQSSIFNPHLQPRLFSVKNDIASMRVRSSFLKTPRTAEVCTGEFGASVWHVSRANYLGTPPADRLALLARLFLGLAPLVRVRYAKVMAERIL